jgi:hypothetical protein
MTSRRWVKKIDDYWRCEYRISVFEAFPGIDLQSYYREGRSWQEVSAMLTRWVPFWEE